MNERLRVYAIGIVQASVCTNLSDDMLIERMNQDYPPDVAPGAPTLALPKWEMRAATFRDGTPNGTTCPDHMVGCRHVLLTNSAHAS